MPKILTKDNIHIYYEFVNKKHYPAKPVLVFIHGWVMNWTFFKDEILFFKKKGYPVLYLDLRGHGKSDKPEKLEDYDIKLMVEDVAQILRKENVKNCVLIGHSMGGMISILFAVKNPGLTDKIILVDSSYKNPLFSYKFSYFRKLMPIKFTKLLIKFIVEHTKIRHHFSHLKELDLSKYNSKPDISIFLDGLKDTSLHACFAVLEEMFNFDASKQIAALKAPVLLIASDHDQFFSLRDAKDMRKKIPNSKLLIEHGTHAVIVRKPEEISERMREFIS